MWAVQAAKLGFRWHIGNGEKKSSFGRITGWVPLVWPFSFGISM